MDNTLEIGRVKRDGKIDIVIQKGDFMGKSYIDIREYVNGDPYEGFTKRGIRIPTDIFPSVLEKLQLV